MKSGYFKDISVSRILHFVQSAGLINTWIYGLHKGSSMVNVHGTLWCLPDLYSILLAPDNTQVQNTDGMMTGRWKYKCSEKNLAQGILSTTNPTWTTMGLNLDLHSEKLVTVTQGHEIESLIQDSCLYSVSDRKATTRDNVWNYFAISWILWKPRLRQIIILVFKMLFSAMQTDLFRNILITSPIRHNEDTFNLQTQLGLAIQPPSGALWQAKSRCNLKFETIKISHLKNLSVF
jgi:hypothetical protein